MRCHVIAALALGLLGLGGGPALADTPINLRGMGSFHVGGRMVEVSGKPVREIVRVPGGPPSKLDPNGKYQVEQMYVQYFLPQVRLGKLPLLMWHGGGLTGATYETTPDGREGWLNFFIRKGWDSYVSDAVERGRAGFAGPDVWPGEPIFLVQADPFERFRIGEGPGSWNADPAKRKVLPGNQFPVEAYEAYMKQIVPRWLSTDNAVIAGYIALVDKVCPCVLLLHSQGGMFGLKVAEARPDKVKAIVANWAPWARHRASASPLGCVSLFVDLRRDIKRSNPDALMYTEPSGHLLRRSMDLNYNYDEQWLVTALADPGSMPPRAVRTAREFAQWMQDRDAFLPHGSQTAHHIDSHDTFWWPEWGKKWRREQFPIGMVRALTAAFISVDGPYMMFTGGEEGVEDLLAAFNGSRRRHPDLWARTGEFVLAPGQDEQLLHIRRVAPTGEVLDVIVNIGQESPVSFALGLTDGHELRDELFSDGLTWLDAQGGTGELAANGLALLISSASTGRG